MDSHTHTRYAAQTICYHLSPRHRTGLDLLRVRKQRLQETYQQLYGDGDTERYPNAIDPRESSFCAVVTIGHINPGTTATSRQQEEIFGLDFDSLLGESIGSRESAQATGSFPRSPDRAILPPKPRSPLRRKVDSLAETLRPENPLGFGWSRISSFFHV